jgi:hypothetical protein
LPNSVYSRRPHGTPLFSLGFVFRALRAKKPKHKKKISTAP